MTSTNSHRLSIAEAVGPLLAQYSSEDQRIFTALAERIAAGRYRAWAEEIGSDEAAAKLRACALREEEIAGRVEGLRIDAPELQQGMRAQHADLPARYAALFDGLSLRDQFLLQAQGERLGAATWRAFADGCSSPREAEVLRSCAPLEEESAVVLESLAAELGES